MEPEAQERILMPGSKGGIIELKPEEAKERILMPGSKIGIIELKPEESKKRILMPGSKSFIVIPQEPEAVPPPANSNTDEP